MSQEVKIINVIVGESVRDDLHHMENAIGSLTISYPNNASRIVNRTAGSRVDLCPQTRSVIDARMSIIVEKASAAVTSIHIESSSLAILRIASAALDLK